MFAKVATGKVIMAYVNVGAEYSANGRAIPTKSALKQALKTDPFSVTFYGTSPFTPFTGDCTSIPQGTTLTVVGPDPYTKRSWYASVTVKNGKVVVS